MRWMKMMMMMMMMNDDDADRSTQSTFSQIVIFIGEQPQTAARSVR
jgi:hypothetical protein